jgi:hypothetical protein
VRAVERRPRNRCTIGIIGREARGICVLSPVLEAGDELAEHPANGLFVL